MNGKGNTGTASALHDPFNFIAGVFCVPFIKKVLHGGDVTNTFCCVNVFHNGDIADTQTNEIFL